MPGSKAGSEMWTRVRRHPNGLDPDLIARREHNKARILDLLDATAYYWDNYAWQLGHLLKGREEARLLPGAFRTDEPVFNVPRLGKNHVRAAQDRELIAIHPDGRRVYLWHPWEKGITPTKPWLYLDNSIADYLRDLERLGEDPADYGSVWYY